MTRLRRLALAAFPALFAVWAVTHWAQYTAPPAPVSPSARVTRAAPPLAVPRPPPAPITTSAPVAVIKPPERVYDKRLNDRVRQFYANRFNGSGTGGYNTGGRQTTLESDQGGAATREFSQQDGVTFLDGNTLGATIKVKPFKPPNTK